MLPLFTTRAQFSERKLLAACEVDNSLLPTILRHFSLEVEERRFEDVVVVDAVHVNANRRARDEQMGRSDTRNRRPRRECVLDGDCLLRLQGTEQLDALDRIHCDHDVDNRNSRPSQVYQSKVDVRMFLVNLLHPVRS